MFLSICFQSFFKYNYIKLIIINFSLSSYRGQVESTVFVVFNEQRRGAARGSESEREREREREEASGGGSESSAVEGVFEGVNNTAAYQTNRKIALACL